MRRGGDGMGWDGTYLERLFVVLDMITVNVMVRANGLSQLGAGDHTRTGRGGTAREQHDAGAGRREVALEHTRGDAEGNTSASLSTLVVGYRPRVSLEPFEDAGEGVFDLANREEEAGVTWQRGSSSSTASRGARHRSGSHVVGGGMDAEHVLDLLGGVVFGAAEDVGLGALCVAEFVDLCL